MKEYDKVLTAKSIKLVLNQNFLHKRGLVYPRG